MSPAHLPAAHLRLARDHIERNPEPHLFPELVALALSILTACGHTRAADGTERKLDNLLEKLTMVDAKLDDIKNDTAQLKAAVADRVNFDADTIAKLTARLTSAAGSSTPMDQAELNSIHSDLQDTIASLKGAATAVSEMPTPPAGGSTPPASGSTTSGAAPAGEPAAPSPAAPPAGAL